MNLESPPLAVDAFDYPLPQERIAQFPMAKRDQSRLLHLQRATGAVNHRIFADLPHLLRSNDVLVVNNSRVIPARLRGRKVGSEGAIEILLVNEQAPNHWWVMLKPGKRVRPGSQIRLNFADGTPSDVFFVVREKNAEGHCLIHFSGTVDVLDVLDDLGEVPLPPYIEPANQRDYADRERYQTVYAAPQGSVAAPTAGLHFTPELISTLEDRGITILPITLHVGLGTFAPVKDGSVDKHQMHSERFEIPSATAASLNERRTRGDRIIAVGTTSVRVLESALGDDGTFQAQRGETNIFIYPPAKFRCVDALITNFHLPKSTLLMLVSAFASPGATTGIEMMKETYRQAIEHEYRFFSYGDAMFIE